MKKILGMTGIVLALAVGAQAEIATLDFTDESGSIANNGYFTYTYDDYDLYGDSTLTVDITVSGETVASGGTARWLNYIDHGWGVNSGSARLDTGEELTFAFSDLKGSASVGVTGFEFIGLISSIQDEARDVVWNQAAADQIDVNGVRLTTYDETQTPVSSLAFGDIAPYDLEDDFITAGDNTAALTIGTTGSFAIEQMADSGRISGFQMNVIPEPATLGMVAAFGGAILFIRRRLQM